MKTYQTEFGALPSVTAILAATQPKEMQDKLRKWQHKQDKVHGHGSAEKISEDAKERGNKLHNLIQSFINRDETEFIEPNNFEFWHKDLKSFLLAIKKKDIIATEKLIYCGKYAGTTDLIALMPDECNKKVGTIVDWKTSHRIKQRAWMEEAFIQCAAYAYAYKEIAIEQLIVCVISPGKLQIFTDNTPNYLDKWDSRLNEFYRQYENKQITQNKP
jgi:hypothetical protein